MGRSRGVRSGGVRSSAPPTGAYRLASASSPVLIVGSGDFSFARGLLADRARARLPPLARHAVVASSLDSRARVLEKYPGSARILEELEKGGVEVLHGVDATRLRETLPPAHASRRFARIVFNFPHVGVQRVHLNRGLLLAFFRAAAGALAEGGEAHVSLKQRLPYTGWGVEERAREAGGGLAARGTRPFCRYPEYSHHTTDPDAKPFAAENCATYVFVKEAGEGEEEEGREEKEDNKAEEAEEKREKKDSSSKKKEETPEAEAARKERNRKKRLKAKAAKRERRGNPAAAAPAAWDKSRAAGISLLSAGEREERGGAEDPFEGDELLERLRASALRVRLEKSEDGDAGAQKEQYAQRKAIEKRERRKKRKDEGTGETKASSSSSAAPSSSSSEAPRGAGKYRCTVAGCGRGFRNYPAARQHRKTVHPELEPLRPEAEKKRKPGPSERDRAKKRRHQ